MSDTTVKGRLGPGSHKVTMSVEAGASNRLPLGGRRVQGMTAIVSVGQNAGQATQGRPRPPLHRPPEASVSI